MSIRKTLESTQKKSFFFFLSLYLTSKETGQPTDFAILGWILDRVWGFAVREALKALLGHLGRLEYGGI